MNIYLIGGGCPLTEKEYTTQAVLVFVVLYNDCKDDHQVTQSSTLSCETVAEPSLAYNSQTAEAMAKWSSLAYVTPASKDKNSVQAVVESEFGSNYRVPPHFYTVCVKKHIYHFIIHVHTHMPRVVS